MDKSHQHHPITPPPELVERLRNDAPRGIRDAGVTRERHLVTAAARWGADQELEACRDKVNLWSGDGDRLYAARRPKPPSLAEQGFNAAQEMSDCMSHGFVPKRSDLDTIRRALERLQELENNG